MSRHATRTLEAILTAPRVKHVKLPSPTAADAQADLVASAPYPIVTFLVFMQSFGMLADEQTSPEQIAIFRRMTPEQRWRTARRLYWTMRRHKAAYLRSQHPDWTDGQLADEVKRIFLNART